MKTGFYEKIIIAHILVSKIQAPSWNQKHDRERPEQLCALQKQIKNKRAEALLN
jgi:hypothetical protein